MNFLKKLFGLISRLPEDTKRTPSIGKLGGWGTVLAATSVFVTNVGVNFGVWQPATVDTFTRIAEFAIPIALGLGVIGVRNKQDRVNS